ncbi:MAG: DNA-directed RNA polymerase subunit omega [Nitrospirota bacterium]
MDIIKLPIEYGNDLFDSRFRLVLVTAQRARQLSEGSPVLVKKRYVKNISLALEEGIEGKLKYLTGEEAKRARTYEYRMKRERMARDSMEEAAAVSLEKMEEIKEAYKAETAVMSEKEPETGFEEEVIPLDEESPEEDFEE